MTRRFHGLAWVFLPAFLAAACLTGCGVRQLARGEIHPPRVTVQGIAVGPLTPAGWPLTCSLLLENPNSQALTVLGYDYDLSLEGRSVAQGASSETVSLPPQGQAQAQFPIFLKMPALLGMAPALLTQHQKLHYQISGGVRLTSLLGGLRVPFRFQGVMTPKEALNDLKPYLK
jgi:LEA14-like dessication related protein